MPSFAPPSLDIDDRSSAFLFSLVQWLIVCRDSFLFVAQSIFLYPMHPLFKLKMPSPERESHGKYSIGASRWQLSTMLACFYVRAEFPSMAEESCVYSNERIALTARLTNTWNKNQSRTLVKREEAQSFPNLISLPNKRRFKVFQNSAKQIRGIPTKTIQILSKAHTPKS